jgi:hypothetical protein
LSPAERGAVGAPDGAAGPGDFNLGLPGVALRKRLGEDVFKSWLGQVAIVSIEGDELILSAPSKHSASYIGANFDTAILACWRVQHPSLARLRMIVAPTPISQHRPAPADPDLRWLAETGVGLAADRMGVTPRRAHERVVLWLRRCDHDTKKLRGLIEGAAALDLIGPQFTNVMNERVRALRHADQSALPLRPVALRSAS